MKSLPLTSKFIIKNMGCLGVHLDYWCVHLGDKGKLSENEEIIPSENMTAPHKMTEKGTGLRVRDCSNSGFTPYGWCDSGHVP